MNQRLIYKIVCFYFLIFQTLIAAPKVTIFENFNTVTNNAVKSLTKVNEIGYFVVSALDVAYPGSQLWRTDGTEAGTYLVKDVNPDLLDFNPLYGNFGRTIDLLTNVDGVLFFVSGRELWRSDGTEAGTIKLTNKADMSPIFSPAKLTRVNDTLFFVSRNELWKSDGTVSGTVLLKNPGSNLSNLMDVNGILYFNANGNIGTSDGTSTGTKLIDYNILSGPNFGGTSNFIPFNGKMFFSYFGILFKMDPANGETFLVKSVPNIKENGISHFTVVNKILFFVKETDLGKELWKSDGTEQGTVLVKDINPGSEGSEPENLTVINDQLFFSADDGIHGIELWKSDGTESGTTLVKDILPDSGIGSIFHNSNRFTNINGLLYFFVYDGDYKDQLWKSDGTLTGTELVLDLPKGSLYLSSSNIVQLNDSSLIFAHGKQLWHSGGSVTDTQLITSFNVKRTFDAPHNFIKVNDTLFIFTYGSLWKIDKKTNRASLLIENIDSPEGYLGLSNQPRDIRVKGNDLYFQIWTYGDPTDKINIFSGVNTATHQWWKSDGSRSGTIKLSDTAAQIPVPDFINGLAKPSSDNFDFLSKDLNGFRYFFKYNEVTELYDLWRTNNTNGNSSLVKRTNYLTNPLTHKNEDTSKGFIGFGDRLYYLETIYDNNFFSDEDKFWVISDDNSTPPIANKDTYKLNKDSILSVTAPGFLNNDTDFDEDVLTAVLDSNVTNGSL